MKRRIILTGLFLIAIICASAQDPKDILKKTIEKCLSVRNGYYEMTKYTKFMTRKDTMNNSYICHFKKLQDDSLFSSAFHNKQFFNGKFLGEIIYTGEELIRTNPEDSTATIMSKKLWSADIESIRHNFIFYSPLTAHQVYPFKNDSDFSDKKHLINYIGEEKVNNVDCFHIKVDDPPQDDMSGMMKTIKTEYHYWISKLDFIPIQYSLTYAFVSMKDTMYQYEKYILNKFELNTLNDETILTLNSIPSYLKINDYVPYKSPEPMPKDTIAPNWHLPSLTGDTINLTDLKGHLVLIDFFYRSCYPCMLALPSLESLYEKYKDKGLCVIGIDPYDKKEDDMPAFLAKRGITYPVLLGGQNVAKEYRISGYPTIYFIDKKGKVIHHQVGYGPGLEFVIEDLIKKHL